MRAIKTIQHYFEQATPGKWHSDCDTEIAGAFEDIIAEAVRQAVEKMQPTAEQDAAISELAQQLARANDELDVTRRKFYEECQLRIKDTAEWEHTCKILRDEAMETRKRILTERDAARAEAAELRELLHEMVCGALLCIDNDLADAINNRYDAEFGKRMLAALKLDERTPASD